MTWIKTLLKKIFTLVERPFPVFFTFHLRPKKASDIVLSSDTSISPLPHIAIIIQGPMIYDQDFTLETIKLYKKLFPEASIVLSTWQYENKEYIEKIKDQTQHVILNKVPEKNGVMNINFQIVSSLAGIKLAKELGARYVLKTRTDQRIYAPNALEYMLNLCRIFPLKGVYKQTERIIACSLNSFKYRMYGISDMNLFGNIDDMDLFWSVEQDEEGKAFRDLALPISEAYLVTKFLKAVGRDVVWSLEQSWRATIDHFCIADEVSLDVYWYKYARMKEHRYVYYKECRNDQELNFREWINLYVNLENKRLPDSSKLKQVIPA